MKQFYESSSILYPDKAIEIGYLFTLYCGKVKMAFEIWFPIAKDSIGMIGSIGILVIAALTYKHHRKSTKFEKQDEWAIVDRPEYDEWIYERKATGKFKVYGYVLSNLKNQAPPIVKIFDEPQTFVKKSKGGIRAELPEEGWELTLYYNKFDQPTRAGAEGYFPKNADMWITQLT